MRLIDTPDFPEAYKPDSGGGCTFLERLRDVEDIDWTFLSPTYMFMPGERTGTFRLGRVELLITDQGSIISYEDYAVALVDDIERPRHIRQRFAVGY